MTTAARRPTALVLEDQYLIAVSLELCLIDMGWDVVIKYALADAMAAIEAQPFDLALVDYHIGKDNSGALMQRLATKGIPFALCSGSMADEIPGLAPNAIILAKPFNEADIRAAVTRLLGEAAIPAP